MTNNPSTKLSFIIFMSISSILPIIGMNEHSIIPQLKDETTQKQTIPICDNVKKNMDIEGLKSEITRLQSSLSLTAYELENSKEQNNLLKEQIKNQKQIHKDDLARTLAEEKKNSTSTINILRENKDRIIRDKDLAIKNIEEQKEKIEKELSKKISQCTVLEASFNSTRSTLEQQVQTLKNEQENLTTQTSRLTTRTTRIENNLTETQEERDSAISHKKYLIITLLASWIGFFIYFFIQP